MLMSVLCNPMACAVFLRYEKAGVVAHEVLSLVRVVATFGTYDRESARYLKDVRMSTSKGKAWGRKAGAMLALPDATFQLIYALLFWYGGRMVRDGEIQVGDILNVFFNVLMSLFTAALGLQYLQDAQTAKVAAWGLFEVIDRESEIDGLGEGGATPGTVNGKLVVEDVRFAYPSAPTDTVLHGLSFTVEKGKTTALVGHSGCGKSTIINLLLRFYEPTSGAITLDGKPLSAYNIQWLRQRIGLVAQQPTLLPGTIRENIALGKANCTNKEIVAAAKSANAHDFIMGFPDQYETEVGALGGKLSGGQKQRIAIARIMIASPDILLLDEATSALDNVSEAKFQDLLSKTKHTRATVVIAHRLSTVEDADEIIVMDHGVVVERGTHASLLANKGKYFNMVNATAASNHPATDADADADANAAASNVSEPVGAAEVTVTGSSLRDNESLATTESKDAENDDAASDSDAAPDKAEAKAMWHFMWGFAKPEIPLVAFACLGAIIHGLSIDAGFLILGLTIEVVAGGYTHKPFQCSVTADNTLGNFTDSFDCLLSSTCKANTACWGCTHTANGSYAAVSDCSATDCTDPYGAGCSFDQVQPAEEEDLNPLILAYVVIFATLFIGKYIQNSSELVAAENMIGKLRAHSFDVFIRKSAAWQDHYRTSDMTEALAVSCADSSKLTVQRWPKIMNILAILIGAIAVAFAYCWRLAAVTIAVLPLLVASQASDMASQLGLDKDGEGASKELKAMADKVAQDAAVIIENLRDIVALGRSRDLIDRYRDDLAKLDVVISKQTPIAGFTAFMAQIIMFCQWGLAFWYGGKQMMDGNCDFGEMNIAIICIIFSGFQAGQEMAFIPDDKAATVTMVKLHKMLTFQTKDDQRLAPGITGGITVAKGEIVFKDVEFAYPTRKSAKVLDKLNLTIEAGKTVALVGQSGCGKSTVISLIQNLYSIDGGSITIDGQDISGASGDTLRRQIAVVPQEPKLFNMSIADNIAYRPQELPVLQEQIEGSAKIANADGFIAELSDGYRYAVGKFGEKLSGGQRQRVAIARSVFSDGDVKVLLLDEATSALDNKNEKLVQMALGTAAMGRTTVIVAHRLSTIKNADKICEHGL